MVKLALQPADIRIADFGLACLIENSSQSITQSGSVIGTPAFAAPEQLLGSHAEPSTVGVDFYSLGAILYFLLTGFPPIRSQGIAQAINDSQNLTPTLPKNIQRSVADDLSAICMKCLEKSDARSLRDSARFT